MRKSLILLLTLFLTHFAFAQEEDEEQEILDLEPVAEAPAEVEGDSSTSEKVFDWSKHQGQREVPHPFAEKGLTRITKEGEYLYKVDESPQKRAASFRIGFFDPINLENPEQAGLPGSTFEENYDQTASPMLLFDYEWQIMQNRWGKFALKAGTGLYVAQGNGHFASVSPVNQGLTPREIFTFIALPNSIGVVYRFQYSDRQLFVPYVDGGGTIFTFMEIRDDDQAPKWGASFAAYGAGGLALNLSYFDAIARAALDREYGINRMYFVAEYRVVQAITTKYDFSSDLMNAGFLMEF